MLHYEPTDHGFRQQPTNTNHDNLHYGPAATDPPPAHPLPLPFSPLVHLVVRYYFHDRPSDSPRLFIWLFIWPTDLKTNTPPILLSDPPIHSSSHPFLPSIPPILRLSGRASHSEMVDHSLPTYSYSYSYIPTNLPIADHDRPSDPPILPSDPPDNSNPSFF